MSTNTPVTRYYYQGQPVEIVSWLGDGSAEIKFNGKNMFVMKAELTERKGK